MDELANSNISIFSRIRLLLLIKFEDEEASNKHP